MHIHTYLCMYVCVYVYICLYACIYVCMYEYFYVYICICECVCMCMCIYIYAWVCVCICVYIYIYLSFVDNILTIALFLYIRTSILYLIYLSYSYTNHRLVQSPIPEFTFIGSTVCGSIA